MRHVVLSGEIEPIALRKMHTKRTRFAFPRALKRLAKVESARLSPRGVMALPFLQMARRLHHAACPAGRRSRTLPSSPPRARPVGLFFHAPGLAVALRPKRAARRADRARQLLVLVIIADAAQNAMA